jgi:hypothetical protein
MPQTTGAITKIEIVPPPGATVAQDDWDKATPLTQDDWDTAKPVANVQAQTKTTAPAQTGVFSQVVDYVKNAVGIPFEMVASMPSQALHHEDAIAGMLQSNQDLFNETYNAFKKGDVPMAAVKGFYYLLNGTGLGGLLNESGTDLNQGRIGAGLGKATAAGIMTAAPAALPFLHGALDKVDAYRATKATAAGNEAYQTNLRKAVGGVSEHGPTADVNDRVAMRPYLSVVHEHAPITNAETGAQGFATAAKLANAQFEYSAEPFAADLLHTNPLQAAQDAVRNMEGPRSTDMAAAMDELASLGLDQDMSVSQAIGILKRLNAEEARHLSLPGATRANLEMHDPRFVANQAAMRTLRNDIYTHMADKGVPGIRQLRLTHGALIEHRNVAQRLIHSGQTVVEGAEKQSAMRKVAAHAARYAAAGVGGLAGPPGAIIGTGVGDVLNKIIAPGLTRDEAFRRAFAQLQKGERPTVAARPRPGPAPAPSHITVEPPESPGPTITVERPADPRQLPPASSHITVEPGTPPTTITVERPSGPRQLPPAPPPRPAGPIPRRALPPGPSPLSSRMQVPRAQAIVDPETGRTVYTSEPASEAPAPPPAEPAAPAAATKPVNLPVIRDFRKPISGLTVKGSPANMSSIPASLEQGYRILPGIRKVPMSEFTLGKGPTGHGFVTVDDIAKVKALAEQIKTTKTINPLIVVRDSEGLYVLEGSHRINALHQLGVRSFPAVVVDDVSVAAKGGK